MSSSYILQLLDQQLTWLKHSSFPSLLLLLFIPFLIKWLFIIIPKTSTKTLPPSPSKLPIIGNLHQLGSHPHRSLLSLAQRHGPIMLLRLGNAPAVVVSSADAAREIMKTQDLVFANRPDFKIYKKLLYDSKDVSAAPYGELWRQLKSICVLHLLSNRRLRSFRVVREEETRLMMNKIMKGDSVSSVINLSEMFTTITNDVVCRAAFGRKYGEGDDQSGKKFRELLREFLVLLGGGNVEDYLPWLSWMNRVSGRDARVDRVAKELDGFLEGVVGEGVDRLERESYGGDHGSVDGENIENFVDILLRIQKEDGAGGSIDRDSIKALILDIFAAGTQTTSAVLEWAMTELLRHPQIMKKLQDEIRGTARGKPRINEDDLEKMHYLKAVIKETLRYHTPIPLLARTPSQDVKVMGYDIEARTTVIINAWAIGRDPMAWSNDAEEFQPERFLSCCSSPVVDFKGYDFDLIPFGAGRRNCPGIGFAMVTNELVLANIVHKFDWKLPDGTKGQDLDMAESTGPTVHRKVPLLAVATTCCDA